MVTFEDKSLSTCCNRPAMAEIDTTHRNMRCRMPPPERNYIVRTPGGRRMPSPIEFQHKGEKGKGKGKADHAADWRLRDRGPDNDRGGGGGDSPPWRGGDAGGDG